MSLILGLDPGKDKFGWAFVGFDGGLRASGISPASLAPELAGALLSGDLDGLSGFVLERQGGALAGESPSLVLLGNGTARKALLEILTSRRQPFELADESNTTLEARPLYWRLHPPRGLARFFPESLRVPPRPVDDLAAWALVLRFLSRKAGPFPTLPATP